MTLTLLDGGLGTELSRRGHDTSLPLWSARPLAAAPEAVVAVHREYLRAGCRVLTTCTFRTHERSLAKADWSGRSDELNRAAVGAARRAIVEERMTGVRVAGSVSPLEACFRPDLVPPERDLDAEHARQAASLAAAGCDLLLVETMGTRREAVAAIRAARAAGLPAWCSFVTDGQGSLLSGEGLAESARAAEQAGAEAVLVNCVSAGLAAAEVSRLRAATGLPVGAYPNTGHDEEGFDESLLLDPEAFAVELARCRDAGAALLGGCCGTTPEHLAAAARCLMG